MQILRITDPYGNPDVRYRFRGLDISLLIAPVSGSQYKGFEYITRQMWLTNKFVLKVL